MAGALPLTAVLVYAALRGGEPKGEHRARELRRLLLEEEVYGGERCIECRTPVEPDWLRCPRCTAQLRQRCACGTTLKLHWSACPCCSMALGRLERFPEPEHVPVGVADADLEHAPGALDGLVDDVGAAAA
jgi:hypothetical protein